MGAELELTSRFGAWGVNAGIDYSFAVGGGRLTPRAQWSYVGRQIATPFPSAVTIVPSRSLFDLRLTYERGNWQVEAFANNATDKTYIASQIQNSTSATGGIIYGAPRQYGVRAKFEFGD